MGGGGAQEFSPPRPAVSVEQSPRPFLASPSPSPGGSPFLPLAAATRGDRGRVRVRPPAQRTGPEQARGSRGPGGRFSETMKSLQSHGQRSRPGA